MEWLFKLVRKLLPAPKCHDCGGKGERHINLSGFGHPPGIWRHVRCTLCRGTGRITD